MTYGKLYVISAPSGAGKTSLVQALVKQVEGLLVSVSHTTREARKGEIEGQHYHFVDHSTFTSMIANNQFLEYAQVFSNYYGTSLHWVNERLNEGIDIILEIDWQGAAQVRKTLPKSCGIFILPPSPKILYERLSHRGTESEEKLAKRRQDAACAISHHDQYDYIVVNDQFDKAICNLKSIIYAQRLSTTSCNLVNQQILEQFLP